MKDEKLKISEEEVKHIANLARLELSEGDILKMQKELAKILDYINLLNEIDTSGIEPTFQSIPMENVMREDEIKEESAEVVNNLLNQAPRRDGNWIKVKGILQ